jgi:hypothetical protein
MSKYSGLPNFHWFNSGWGWYVLTCDLWWSIGLVCPHCGSENKSYYGITIT